MNDKTMIFIGGLHRSGTSLLHEILCSHPQISGFSNTGVPENEGQHLQTVYSPANTFGGPGHFGFNTSSFMDEKHPLATTENAKRLFQQWSHYWDLDKYYLVEKSPPNLVRTRFLQKLFPRSIFIITFRHPIAVSYATRKWSRTSIHFLLEHYFRCYERFIRDLPFLEKVYILRYEEFVAQPVRVMNELFKWIGIDTFEFNQPVISGINNKYFKLWALDHSEAYNELCDKYEHRANNFGYSIKDPDTLHHIANRTQFGKHAQCL